MLTCAGLMTSSQSKETTGSFNSSTMLRIGTHRVLVTSEVDGTSPAPQPGQADTGAPADSTPLTPSQPPSAAAAAVAILANGGGRKTCNSCGHTLDRAQFSKSQRRKNADQAKCLECVASGNPLRAPATPPPPSTSLPPEPAVGVDDALAEGAGVQHAVPRALPAGNAGSLVEIKSTKKGTGKVFTHIGLVVQLACNGSQQLLVVSVDKSERDVERLQWYNADSVRHNQCKARNIYAGQRVLCLLNHLLLHGNRGSDGGGGCGSAAGAAGGCHGDAAAAVAGVDDVGGPAAAAARRWRYCLDEGAEELAANAGPVFKLTFDAGKAPVFERLRPEHPDGAVVVTVLPPDLDAWMRGV